MQIVVATYGTRIRVRKGLLVVEGKDGARQYPLHEVDEVFLLTGGISITTKALRALLRAGAVVAVFDQRGEPLGVFMRPVGDAPAPREGASTKPPSTGGVWKPPKGGSGSRSGASWRTSSPGAGDSSGTPTTSMPSAPPRKPSPRQTPRTRCWRPRPRRRRPTGPPTER
jgi:hypothetical protein